MHDAGPPPNDEKMLIIGAMFFVMLGCLYYIVYKYLAAWCTLLDCNV